MKKHFKWYQFGIFSTLNGTIIASLSSPLSIFSLHSLQEDLPDLAYSVHQCARFCSDPKASHEQAVKRIICYLLYLRRRKGIGIRYRPDVTKSVETYLDASFAVEWNLTPLLYWSILRKSKQSVVIIMPSSAVCSECEDLKREIQSLKMIISNRERAFKEESIKTAL